MHRTDTLITLSDIHFYCMYIKILYGCDLNSFRMVGEGGGGENFQLMGFGPSTNGVKIKVRLAGMPNHDKYNCIMCVIRILFLVLSMYPLFPDHIGYFGVFALVAWHCSSLVFEMVGGKQVSPYNTSSEGGIS